VIVKSQNITVNFTVNSSAQTITAIWPTTLPLNGPNQNITVYCTNFYSASQSHQTVAKIQGVSTALTTTVISSTILNAGVPSTALLAAGNLNIIGNLRSRWRLGRNGDRGGKHPNHSRHL